MDSSLGRVGLHRAWRSRPSSSWISFRPPRPRRASIGFSTSWASRVFSASNNKRAGAVLETVGYAGRARDPGRAVYDASGVEILWTRVLTRGDDGKSRTVCDLELAWEDALKTMAHGGGRQIDLISLEPPADAAAKAAACAPRLVLQAGRLRDSDPFAPAGTLPARRSARTMGAIRRGRHASKDRPIMCCGTLVRVEASRSPTNVTSSGPTRIGANCGCLLTGAGAEDHPWWWFGNRGS